MTDKERTEFQGRNDKVISDGAALRGRLSRLVEEHGLEGIPREAMVELEIAHADIKVRAIEVQVDFAAAGGLNDALESACAEAKAARDRVSPQPPLMAWPDGLPMNAEA